MYVPLDFSLMFENINLGKISGLILAENFDFLKRMFNSAIGMSPSNRAEAVLESSLKRIIPTEIPPEMSTYLSRVALRSIVGLKPIEINAKDKGAIRKLKGSISWISKEKMDVTEIIRDMRDR